MESKELIEKLYGEGAPYPGMQVEWECFAGAGEPETGKYSGEITRISWCPHCGLPSFQAESISGANFLIRWSQTVAPLGLRARSAAF